MKRILLAIVALFIATASGFAQEQAAPLSPRVLPMFGEKQKTEAEQKQDEKFLTSSDKNFTDRREASKFFMERGWEYLNEGQVDTAMYRFNLAWLLNPDNKDTYWAFGLVTSARGDNQTAIRMYEKALTYDGKNALLLSDAAAAYLAVYQEKKKKKDLKKASGYLAAATAADPNNAYALYNISKVKYQEKKYKEAWDYLHKSRSIDMSSIDYAYILELSEKMPDPQGFFNATDAAANTGQ
ncbi:tetratricopeptide repeat protein [Pontibacter chinhatensis]|uniref:Uncharacterized protein n=1 Tax=Pontibacter chinhatensis TaxID=1436961 RepID=A0A1I2M924_9BACT|nr:hypothetical protein [Pontibacter chinhatensis]SFF87973.1 hypothetical protein SAMN05421739_101222 [Pontibacter chinhatensis]